MFVLYIYVDSRLKFWSIKCIQKFVDYFHFSVYACSEE